jgi:hypothetical protein
MAHLLAECVIRIKLKCLKTTLKMTPFHVDIFTIIVIVIIFISQVPLHTAMTQA